MTNANTAAEKKHASKSRDVLQIVQQKLCPRVVSENRERTAEISSSEWFGFWLSLLFTTSHFNSHS